MLLVFMTLGVSIGTMALAKGIFETKRADRGTRDCRNPDPMV
jgi:hypothetical protein